MTRRQVHAGLLIIGVWIAAYAATNWQPEWLNRSDTFFVGLFIAALGVHGLWKTDPR